MKKRIFPRIYYSVFCSVFLLAVVVLLGSTFGLAQSVPPTSPTGLTATAATCGEVDLTWSPAIDNSGTGLKAYSIWRSNDGVNTVTSIGAARVWFDDTMYVRSSDTMSYYVVAVDNAGNQSLPSDTITLNTPACPLAAGEQIVDSAHLGALGKKMALYGTTTAWLYQKLNNLAQPETWIDISDSATGQNSHFLLHSYPGYSQVEDDYVLASATELWTLSNGTGTGGQVLVSQYQLNGSPSSAATLLSTQSLGDSNSSALSLIRLQSGALMVAWNETGVNTVDLTTGFAYRSPSGVWAVHFPVTVPNGGFGGDITRARMAMVQHPADASIWAFVKRDSFSNIAALHFSEITNDISIDSITPGYITQNADGINGPEGEFPYLTASPDPTRNAILLAYQNYQYQFVYIDPLYGSLSNNIFLKQARVSIAQISADGSRSFIPFQGYIERVTQFGMSVLSDGTIWLAYQPINSQALTWNAVYASEYQNSVWSASVFTALDYNGYNQASGLAVSLVYHPSQPWAVFMTPDQKVHTFDLSNLGPAPADTIPPATSITSPATGATVSGNVTISASASDNVGVTKVELWLDGSPAATDTTAPYSFAFNTATVANGTHTLQTKAYDAVGNVGLSAVVSVSVNNSISSANLTVSITNPTNGSTVARNQKVTISAAASDNVAVTRIEFYVNNNLLGAATTAPYSYPWKVPGKKGLYNIQAKGYDSMGNSAAQAVTVTAQ